MIRFGKGEPEECRAASTKNVVDVLVRGHANRVAATYEPHSPPALALNDRNRSLAHLTSDRRQVPRSARCRIYPTQKDHRRADCACLGVDMRPVGIVRGAE